jgi:hypothetical protein
MLMAPPDPDVDIPLLSKMKPELPDLLLPVDSVTDPLTPAEVTEPVVISMDPLPELRDVPDARATAPPEP